MRIARIVSRALLIVPLTACGGGSSVPSTKSGRDEIAAKYSSYGSLVEFVRDNGEDRGQIGYVVMFRAGIRLKDGLFWDARSGLETRESCERPYSFKNCSALPPETLYIVKGELLYRRAERGWRVVDWNQGATGVCYGSESRKSLSTCEKAVWKK